MVPSNQRSACRSCVSHSRAKHPTYSLGHGNFRVLRTALRQVSLISHQMSHFSVRHYRPSALELPSPDFLAGCDCRSGCKSIGECCCATEPTNDDSITRACAYNKSVRITSYVHPCAVQLTPLTSADSSSTFRLGPLLLNATM